MKKTRKLALGIDIGGTNTVFGFVDKKGNIHAEQSIETDAKKGAKKLFSLIADEVNKFLSEHENEFILAGIGIGAPNSNYFTGEMENPPNLNWGKINIVEEFKKFYDIPVFVTNDANATAIGEKYFGAAKGMKNFIVITLGTGLGSGIVIDGRLVYGADGFAGELGHTIVTAGGRECGCGNRGCLETYVSATGIRRTVQVLVGRLHAESALRDISFTELTAKKIAELAEAGDPIAIEAFQYTGRILGVSLANAVAFSRPEAIILFGGLANSGDLLFKPTIESFEKNLLDVYRGKIKILKSGLSDFNAAVLGAAALAWSELKKVKK
jgi:glucokinase